MTVRTGDAPQIPHALLRAASDLTIELGRSVVADDFFLLALAELPSGAPARAALEAAGANADRIRGALRDRGDSPKQDPPEVIYPPAIYRMMGRAEGLAAAEGVEPTNEHVLIAILWDPASHSSYLLGELGVGRDAVLRELSERGVKVPTSPLPEQRVLDVGWGEKVRLSGDELSGVLKYLVDRIGPEAVWGWNYDDEGAYVHGTDNVDVAALVEAARAQA